MAREKEKAKEAVEAQGLDADEVSFDTAAKDVAMQATSKNPFRKEGKKFFATKRKAKILEARGWAKVLLLLVMLSFSVAAQTSVDRPMYNALGTDLTADTVTNTGTGTLTSRRISGPSQSVTVQAVITEISGTTNGFLQLQGSLDGTNFLLIRDSTNAVLHSNVRDAADVASQTLTWHLRNSPYLYYRISWTGVGTMSARFSARIMKH